MNTALGFSGRIARLFQENELTPLLALTALLLGLFAVIITPREEEPQIDVTFANVFVAFPGADSVEVENKVSIPMEQVLAEIDGIKHVYSVSRPGLAVLTIQFEVGEHRTEALVRLYNAIYSNQDWRPANLGVMPPLVKPMGIDDVPIIAATLWTEDPERGGRDLLSVAHTLEAELKRVPGTRDVYTIGGAQSIVHVELDPLWVAGFGLTLDDLRLSLTAGNSVQQAGSLVSAGVEIPVQAGVFLSDRDDVRKLVVGVFDGRPVYLEDIANITFGTDQPEQYAWYASGPVWMPRCRWMFSTTTMASSTRMPMENISANSETRLSVKPQAQEANRVTVSVMMTAVPTISASRQPMVSNTSRMTEAVAKVSFWISLVALSLAVLP